MLPLYLDQIDADEAGYEWLHQVGLDNDCTEIRPIALETDGRFVIAFKKNEPFAFFAVIRTEQNYSVLFKSIIHHPNGLQPCPFCGSTNITEYPQSDSQASAIYCDDCPCGVEDSDKPMEELRELWNKRYYS